MAKKVTKKVNISVDGKKQGYWVNKENLRKGERTIQTKQDKALVKRNRAGYDYNKTITGYEWTKEELRKKLAERARKGLIEQKSIARDLAHTHRITKEAPIITAKEFFSRDDWYKQDILGIDSPPGMTLSEIKERYKEDQKAKEISSKKEGKIHPVLGNIDLHNAEHELAVLKNRLVVARRDRDPKSTIKFKDQIKEVEDQIRRLKGEPKPKRIESDRLIQAQLEDIDKEKAVRAFSNTSWSPERRGEYQRKAYVEHINNLHDDLIKKVPAGKHQELKEELERYRVKYLEKTNEQLHRHTSLASSAVTGRSNFPVASQKKKNEVYSRKNYEFLEWQAKAQQSIKRKMGLVKSGISSDDKNAIQKLEIKLQSREKFHKQMIQANKIIKSKTLDPDQKEKQLSELGYTQFDIQQLLKPDFAGRIGYESYRLNNNRAEIRRLEDRLKTLERQRSETTASKQVGDIRIIENVEDNRVRIIFPGKPDPAVIKNLKSNGFIWSPSNNAWQRKRSERATYLANSIVEDLQEKKEVKKVVDRSKSIATGKNLYLEKYSPGKTILKDTKTLTDMQKRRLIKTCIDNDIDTRELDPSLKYDENQEIIKQYLEAGPLSRDDISKADQQLSDLEGVYYGPKTEKRIRERKLDAKTTEPTVISKADLVKKRKKKKLEDWKEEPYLSKTDVEEIDTKK